MTTSIRTLDKQRKLIKQQLSSETCIIKYNNLTQQLTSINNQIRIATIHQINRRLESKR